MNYLIAFITICLMVGISWCYKIEQDSLKYVFLFGLAVVIFSAALFPAMSAIGFLTNKMYRAKYLITQTKNFWRYQHCYRLWHDNLRLHIMAPP